MIKKCEKCNSSFDTKTPSGGYSNKRKLCFECSPLGSKNENYTQWQRSAKDLAMCSQCNKEKVITEFYNRGKAGNYRPQSRCKQCEKELLAIRNKEFKQWAVDYKGGKCGICNYDKCLAAMDFHHLRDKKIQPAKMQLWSKKRAMAELDKCQLLCCRCHREVHDNELECPK